MSLNIIISATVNCPHAAYYALSSAFSLPSFRWLLKASKAASIWPIVTVVMESA